MLKNVLGITGTSLGLGIMGDAITPINSNIGSAIGQAGITGSRFISPAVNISMGGHVIKQLRGLKR